MKKLSLCFFLMGSLTAIVGAFMTTLLIATPADIRPWMALIPLTNFQKTQFTFEDIPSLKGKLAIVTGANTGLGFSTAKFLALNGAKVVMACRNDSACTKAMAEIQDECHIVNERKCQLEVSLLDLEDLKSVGSFVKRFKSREKPLDILVNNAGLVWSTLDPNKDTGVPKTMQVNHIGPSALTLGLMASLKKAKDARVVMVSSSAHKEFRLGLKRGFTSPESIHAKSADDYVFDRAYMRSKLANIHFTKRLARELRSKGVKNVFVNSIEPGFVKTELARRKGALSAFGPVGPVVSELIDKWGSLVAYTSDQGSLTSLRPATDPAVAKRDINGQHFTPLAWLHPDVTQQCSRTAQSKEGQDILWDWTMGVLRKAKVNVDF